MKKKGMVVKGLKIKSLKKGMEVSVDSFILS